MFYNTEYNFNLITKINGHNNLINFFKKNIPTTEFGYYIMKNQDINDYIIDPEDSELNHIINEHIEIILKYINLLNNKNNLFNLPNSLKISFIKDELFFDNSFAINDILYVNYNKLINVFYTKEDINDVVKDIPPYMMLYEDYIIDIFLYKSLYKSIIHILHIINKICKN